MDNTADTEQPALFAFIVGNAAKALAGKTTEAREAVVLERMEMLFGADVGTNNPVYYEKDWNLDPFSEGCPAAHFSPGAFL